MTDQTFWDELAARIRTRMTALLADNLPMRGTAALLEDAENEINRHTRAVADLARTGSVELEGRAGGGFRALFDRPLPADVDPRASKPSAVLEVADDHAARGVVFACPEREPDLLPGGN